MGEGRGAVWICRMVAGGRGPDRSLARLRCRDAVCEVVLPHRRRQAGMVGLGRRWLGDADRLLVLASRPVGDDGFGAEPLRVNPTRSRRRSGAVRSTALQAVLAQARNLIRRGPPLRPLEAMVRFRLHHRDRSRHVDRKAIETELGPRRPDSTRECSAAIGERRLPDAPLTSRLHQPA